MRPGRVLILFAVVVFLGGALLAPCLFWLAQWAAGHWPAFEGLARSPFHRYVNRALLVLALAGIWPLMRALGARTGSEVGWVKPTGQGRRLGLGLALGFFSLALVAGLALLLGARQFKADLRAVSLVKYLFSAAGTAVVVATLEETFFRGAIFGGLRRVHAWTTALVLSSAIYAIVHFFQRPPSPTTVEWDSGLRILLLMLQGFVDWPTVVPGFFTLTLAGAILGLAYHRTGNLYFSIGLHAGWIFWLKFYGAATVAVQGANLWWWGSSKLIDGWLAMGSLLLALALLPRLTPPARANRPL